MNLETANTREMNENAVELLTRTVGASKESISILALGPLTNLADAFAQHPTLTRKIEMVYSMGGAVSVAGNVITTHLKTESHKGSCVKTSFEMSCNNHNAAEWNFFVDPLAAQQVIASDAPLTLVPLDATNRVPVTRAFLEKLNAQQTTRAAQLAKKILDTRHADIENGGYYFWDPLAAVVVTSDGYIASSVVTWETQNLAVAITDDADAGRIALRQDGSAVRVAIDADAAHFEAMFLQTLNGQFK